MFFASSALGYLWVVRRASPVHAGGSCQRSRRKVVVVLPTVDRARGGGVNSVRSRCGVCGAPGYVFAFRHHVLRSWLWSLRTSIDRIRKPLGRRSLVVGKPLSGAVDCSTAAGRCSRTSVMLVAIAAQFSAPRKLVSTRCAVFLFCVAAVLFLLFADTKKRDEQP